MAVAAGISLNKVVYDIQECIAALKKEFQDSLIPINDDNTDLHRFCSKLEFILQYGLKEKLRLLGGKKDYWDYFCRCLASEKGIHDGLKFVKSIPEIQTSLGKGRAFVRFCLMHHCLADTLQKCLLQEKITSNWYDVKSLFTKKYQYQKFISILYDLNEINFDLCPRGHDLDVSWPTFARKLFGAANAWKPPSRSVSLSSLASLSSVQLDTTLPNSSFGSEDDASVAEELEQIKLERDELLDKVNELKLREIQAIELSKENKNLQKLKDYLESSAQQLLGHCNEISTAIDTLQVGEANAFADTQALITAHSSQLELVLENKSMEEKVDSLVSNLQNDKTTAETKCRNLEDKLEILENKAQTKSLEYEQSFLDLCNKNKELFKTSQELEKELQVKNKDLSDTHNKVSRLTEQIKRRDKDLNEMGEKLTKLLDRIDKTDAHNVEIGKMCNYLREENLRLRREVTGMDDDAAVASPGNAVLENKVKNLEKQLKDQVVIHSDEKTLLMSELNMLKAVQHQTNTELSNHEHLLTTDKDAPFLEEDVAAVYSILKKHECLVDNLQRCLHLVYSENGNFNNELKAIGSRLMIPCAENDFQSVKQAYRDMKCDEKLNLESSSIEKELLIALDSNSKMKPLLSSLNLTFDKLLKMVDAAECIHEQSYCSKTIYGELQRKVYDQEKALCGVSAELESVKKMIGDLKSEHNKLQTAEAIMKYELREKRKMLSRLRQQLESTRDNWHKVQRKNKESEVQWQGLREEFARRHKQASEESGFIDDGKPESNSTTGPNSPPDIETEPTSPQPEDNVQLPPSSPSAVEPPCEVAPAAPPAPEIISHPGTSRDEEITPSRLSMLEDQCRVLFASVVEHCNRSVMLEERLHNLIEPSDDESGVSLHSDAVDSLQSPVSALNETASEIAEPIELEAPCINPESEISTVNTCCECDDNEIIPAVSSDAYCCVDDQNSEECVVAENDLNEITNSEDVVDASMPCFDSKLEESQLSASEPEDEIVIGAGYDKKGHDLRKRALGTFVSRLKAERHYHETHEADMKCKIDDLVEERNELQKSLILLRNEMSDMNNKDTDFRKRAEFIFRQERDSFETRLKNLITDKLNLQQALSEVSTTLDEKNQQIIKLEKEVVSAFSDMEFTKSTLEQETMKLRDRLMSEGMRYQQTVKNLSEQEVGICELKDKICDQETIIQTLEDELNDIRENRLDEQEQQWEMLKQLKDLLSTRNEECQAMSDIIQKLTSDLDEERLNCRILKEEIEQLKSQSEETTDKLEAELSIFRNDSEELKKKLVKLTKEKDLLWKRTDQLSHLQRVQITDRWIDDKDVVECQCKVAFSLTVRKHHCRLCGRIFCHSCANNWLMTTASSKRVRVCNECYLQQLKVLSSSFSEIPEINEETDDDATSVASSAATKSSSQVHFPNETNTALRDSFQATSESMSPARAPIDFDVITDEEVALSFSACSSYSEEEIQPIMPMSITYDVTEILDQGEVTGESWIPAGCKYGLPVIVEDKGTVVRWRFTSEPKSLAFGVAWKDLGAEMNDYHLLLASTRVKSHLHPTQGHLTVRRPGTYLLIFDNGYSRFTAKKVQYQLTAQKPAPSATENNATDVAAEAGDEENI